MFEDEFEQFIKDQMDYYDNIFVDTSRQKTINAYGKTTAPYSRDWPIYEKACRREKLMFFSLLRDAVDHLNINYDYQGNGRPSMFIGDIIKCLCIKAHSGYSSWRLESELKIAKAMGIIDEIPKRSTINKYAKDTTITPFLHQLVRVMAEPLSSIETHFSADASGMRTEYGAKRWKQIRHTPEEMRQIRSFVKVNIMSGVTTNIITSVIITPGNMHESPFFKDLLGDTAKHFNLKEVSADAGYLSKKNVKAIASFGAEPFIKPKKTVNVPRSIRGPWGKMLNLWKHAQPYFASKYHRRSNVESTFGALKRKYGDFCRSKKFESQENEILCKIICFNCSKLAEALLSYDLKEGFIASS